MDYFLFEFKNTSCLGKLYLLPKIHKRLSNVPGRPVISNCGTPTEKVSEFLDYHLQPVMRAGKSYIRDTNHFLEKLKSLGKVPDNAILVTADVVGLYPSIPHEQGLKTLYEALEKREKKLIPSSDLKQMAEFVLKNNYFEFNTQIKRQISGTAIGTKFAPSYACIFMDRVESDFLASEEIQPWVWLRYIDDIFFVWTEGEEKLREFLERLNSFHPNLKFTFDYSTKQVNFLDLIVSTQNNEFVTDLYCKPTDCHQFLHYDSCHPTHTKSSIIYSQGLRIRRLCSDDLSFERHMSNLGQWFGKRGYPKDLIDSQIKRVSERTTRNNENCNSGAGKKNVGVPLVLTYHPRLSSFGKIIRKHLPQLYESPEVKTVFSKSPFVSFRKPCSLKSYLVRAKVYPLERNVGCKGCGKKRCEVCRNVEASDSFTSNITGHSYKINHHLDCDDKCIIYLLTCKVCGIQYVGETCDKFRSRWNNYRAADRKVVKGETVMQQSLHEHFGSAGPQRFFTGLHD